MEEYKRFTVSLPEKLYEQFELFRNKMGISRSDAIRKAMHTLMISEENLSLSSGDAVGCITIIMTHEHPDIKQEEHSHDASHSADHDHDYGSGSMYANVHQTDELLKTDIQHHFYDIIISTMHIHLEFEKCLEIIAVSGLYARVKKLKDELQKLKSILSVGFFIIDKKSNEEVEKKKK
ncbi:MAG: ribbon-helix-helix protein, CopG family [Candidatus Lokiarchaeota archaeon]|nr:ribbon-helix-helix protein, CopG family [Candidatus Lokiarchaeota archaeon]